MFIGNFKEKTDNGLSQFNVNLHRKRGLNENEAIAGFYEGYHGYYTAEVLKTIFSRPT